MKEKQVLDDLKEWIDKAVHYYETVSNKAGVKIIRKDVYRDVKRKIEELEQIYKD